MTSHLLEKEAAEHTAELLVLRENLKMVESMKGAIKSAGLSDLSVSELAALVRAGVAKGDKAVQCERTALEKERLEGQVKSQQVMLARHGTEMPACWANKVTGKPEYIFSIDLTSTGLIVHDQKLPQRAAEQALLPLQGISFDIEVSPDVFRSQMNQLLSWSKEHGCRFFVTAKDLTQSTEKDAYKRMLRALEDRFYKLEIK